MAEPRTVDLAELRPRLARVLDFAARQVEATARRTPNFFPIYTVGGKWEHGGELWTDWCAGFHAGMMWLIAKATGDPAWRARAEHYSGLLEHKQHDRDVHDLGFIFLNTYKPWYDLTGDKHVHDVLITAGRTLAPPVQRKGSVSPVVRRAREPVHRHHDECPDHLLRREGDEGQGPA